MDGSPPLLTNIQFAEAKKGYDRDQVDNFLRELSVKISELQDMLRQATQRAEAAEAKVTEASKAKGVAEAMVDKAKADAESARTDLDATRAELDELKAAPAKPVDEIEAASGVLAMAKKTADDTVAEAERHAEQIRVEALAKADTMLSERGGEVQGEIDRLHDHRNDLQAEVDGLRRAVAEHRQRLRDGVDALSRVLDDPTHFEPDPPKGSSRDDRPSADDSVTDVTDRQTEHGSSDDAGSHSEPVPSGAAPVDRSEGGAALHTLVIPNLQEGPSRAEVAITDAVTEDAVGTDDAVEVEDETEQRAAVVEPRADESDAGPAASSDDEHDGEPDDDGPDTDEVVVAAQPAAVEHHDTIIHAATGTDGPVGSGRARPDLRLSQLFGDEAVVDEPTQAYDVLDDGPSAPTLQLHRTTAPDEESPLGEPDAEADAAMRAFFESDPDDPANTPGNKGRFLRRK
jgi:DivIVA domain-containing protein